MEFPSIPLGQVLRRSQEAVELNPTESYKQITVRMHHRGAVLRGIQQGSEIGASRQYLAREGQLILSRIDARNGAISLVPTDLDGAVVTNDFWLYDIDQSHIVPAFLNHFVGTRTFIDCCRKASEGTTNRVRLQPEAFLRIPIPLPPLREQQRIVERVEALAAKIEEARGLRRAADEELVSFVTSLHIASSGPEKHRLGELLVLDEIRESVVPGMQYPQVGVLGFGQGLFAKGAIDATRTTYKYFNRLFSGAVVLSQVKGWEGAIAVCPEELSGWFASPEYRTFRCIEDRAIPAYFATLLGTPWFHGHLKAATRGVGARRERTRPEAFLELVVQMPSLEDQREAVTILSQLPQLKRLQAEVAAELDALMPVILDQAFRGKL